LWLGKAVNNWLSSLSAASGLWIPGIGGAKHVLVREVELPEISDYFKLFISAENYLTHQRSMTPRFYDEHVWLVDKTPTWMALVPGEFEKNFASVQNEFAFYEIDNRVLLFSRKTVGFLSTDDYKIRDSAKIVNTHKFGNPLILYSYPISNKDVVTVYVMDVCEPEYVMFHLVPRSGYSRVEEAEVDYFWEIISLAITSDRRTAFKIRMKWR